MNSELEAVLKFCCCPCQKRECCSSTVQAWLQPPLNLHFIFSCPIQDFKARPRLGSRRCVRVWVSGAETPSKSCWLTVDAKAYPIVAEEDPRRTTANREASQSQSCVEFLTHLLRVVTWRAEKVYQRLKGWVLCDSDGLALVTLREEGAWASER